MRSPAVAVLALVAATLSPPAPARATTAADICVSTTQDPCVLQRVVTVTAGSTLDFGARAFVIKAPDGRLQVGAGDTLSIVAGSMTVETGPGGRLRGAGSCAINVSLGGAFAAVRGAGTSDLAIDISSQTDAPCELNVDAGGDVSIAAAIQARGTLDSPGGIVELVAAGRVTLSGQILVLGPLTGGSAALVADGAIEVTDEGVVDASDADANGSVLLDAGTDVAMRGRLDVSANGGRPQFGCDAGLVQLNAGGDITIAGAISGIGASNEGCTGGGGSLEINAGGSVFVNGPIDLSGGFKGFGGFIDPVVAGRDFVQTAPIVVRAGGATGVGGYVDVIAARRLHVSALLDLSGGSGVDPVFGFPGGGGNVSLRGGEALEIAGEIDADGADYGSVLLTTAGAGANDLPGRIAVTGSVHAVSSGLEDFSADVLLEACDVDVAPSANLTKTGPASRILVRASGGMRIAGTMNAADGTIELHYRDPARPPSIVAGASLTPPPISTATPDEPLRPCPCTVDAGVPGILCNDGNVCTQERCDPELGCTSTPLAGEGISGCDDGTVCNGRESCSALRCIAGVPPIADDGDPCTEDGPCDPAVGYPRTPKTGLPAASCRMDRIETALATADIPDDVSPKGFKKIGDLARKIRALLDTAETAAGRRRTKLLRAARRKVRQLDRAVDSPKSRLTPALAQLLALATVEAETILKP